MPHRTFHIIIGLNHHFGFEFPGLFFRFAVLFHSLCSGVSTVAVGWVGSEEDARTPHARAQTHSKERHPPAACPALSAPGRSLPEYNLAADQ